MSGPRLSPSPPALLSLGILTTLTLQREPHAAKLQVGTRVGSEAVSSSSQPRPFANGSHEGLMRVDGQWEKHG